MKKDFFKEVWKEIKSTPIIKLKNIKVGYRCRGMSFTHLDFAFKFNEEFRKNYIQDMAGYGKELT